jgi:hypothetical protein
MRLRREVANHPQVRVPTSSFARDRVLVDTRIKSLKYVIFPENRWIQVWDLFMIYAIWYYTFAIPFSLGVSRGYYSGKMLLVVQKMMMLCKFSGLH